MTFLIMASSGFSHGDLITFFLSLAILIGLARILGEVAQKFGQPAILGELMTGIILGPSILGMISPELNQQLFPSSGPVHIGLKFMSSLAIALFLLLAGMEINLRNVLKQGKAAMAVSFGGMLIPFGIGFAVAFAIPQALGMYEVEDKIAFSLFFAIALSISALPVIARILMDLKLIKSHLGITVLTAAIVNDLIGWLIFAMVLGMIGASGAPHSITFTMTATICFALFMFTIGTKIIEKIYIWVQAHLSWPAGPLTFIVCGALLCAAFTEWVGIHAIFGTFIFGVSIGQCPHIREKTQHTLESFISFIITPIFFATIGLEVNFFASFDFQVVAIILLIGTVGKIAGSWIGGRIAGLQNRESLAIGCAMNARGVMEIILGLIAYQAGLISESLFVALVVLALLTSMTSGALVQKILRRSSPVQLPQLLKKDLIFFDIKADDRDQFFQEASQIIAEKTSVEAEKIHMLIKEREELASTGLENNVAIPHCRLQEINKPMIFTFQCHNGIDFYSLDGSLAKAIFVILTPQDDFQSQLEIISQVSYIFQDPKNSQTFLKCKDATQVIAFANSHQKSGH